MTVHVVTHRDGLAHEPGPGPPERADRLTVLLAALDAPHCAVLEGGYALGNLVAGVTGVFAALA